LLATKARVLVTHSVSFLSKFDQLVYVRRGIIVESGSYAKLAGDKASYTYKLMSVSPDAIFGEIADSIVVTGIAIRTGLHHPEARHLSGMVKDLRHLSVLAMH
jgi:ABC-type microcin C transport system duplicated ATPase subunit YejF